MASKKKIYEPLTGQHIDQALNLCDEILSAIKKFNDDIYYLDSNQLFEVKYSRSLLNIANKIDELNFHLRGLMSPKSIYFNIINTALLLTGSIPNIFILTAYYIDPKQKYKRLLNQNAFSYECSTSKKRIKFVQEVLKRAALGDPYGRDVVRPYFKCRLR